MAEMTRDEKAAISHRGRAARRLAELLRPVDEVPRRRRQTRTCRRRTAAGR